MVLRRFLSALFGLVIALLASPLISAELSLLTGLYQHEKSDPVKKNRISVGGRYGDYMAHSQNLTWYVDALLATVSYSGSGAPDDGMDVGIGGGGRLFFDPLGDRFRPFIGVGAGFLNSKYDDEDTLAIEDITVTGLFYGADAGLRLMMGNLAEFEMSDVSVFLDFELNLFKNALFATRKEKTTDAAGNRSEKKGTSIDLFVDGQGGFNDMKLGIGAIF